MCCFRTIVCVSTGRLLVSPSGPPKKINFGFRKVCIFFTNTIESVESDRQEILSVPFSDVIVCIVLSYCRPLRNLAFFHNLHQDLGIPCDYRFIRQRNRIKSPPRKSNPSNLFILTSSRSSVKYGTTVVFFLFARSLPQFCC